uniref:Sperm microtubule inner protein 8 n=1 Tax=Vombatus ursinus TaxID=29139 RepID=A0A4X2MF27_VOMUR
MARIIDLVPWSDNSIEASVSPAIMFPTPPRRNMLPGVKQQLYHPYLPTLRQMDMDTVMAKLPDEHCQSSTYCCKGNNAHLVQPVWRPAHCWVIMSQSGQLTCKVEWGKVLEMHVLCAGSPLWRMGSICHGIEVMTLAWVMLHLLSLSTVEGFSGYAVRYLKPDITQCWRYCLNQNPSLDQYGQKPLPNDTMNTFRSFSSAYR